ncbi:MAG: hypothetical protein Q3960_02285 [Lactobacillus sp.]|nr:hypothetical protein [Lactobacillus sp.]
MKKVSVAKATALVLASLSLLSAGQVNAASYVAKNKVVVYNAKGKKVKTLKKGKKVSLAGKKKIKKRGVLYRIAGTKTYVKLSSFKKAVKATKKAKGPIKSTSTVKSVEDSTPSGTLYYSDYEIQQTRNYIINYLASSWDGYGSPRLTDKGLMEAAQKQAEYAATLGLEKTPDLLNPSIVSSHVTEYNIEKMYNSYDADDSQATIKLTKKLTPAELGKTILDNKFLDFNSDNYQLITGVGIAETVQGKKHAIHVDVQSIHSEHFDKVYPIYLDESRNN